MEKTGLIDNTTWNLKRWSFGIYVHTIKGKKVKERDKRRMIVIVIYNRSKNNAYLKTICDKEIKVMYERAQPSSYSFH